MCDGMSSIVDLFLGQRAGARIDVELHDLGVLDALAFPTAVVGLESSDVSLAGVSQLLRHLFLGDPVGAGLVGQRHAGAGDQRDGCDERTPESGHGLTSALNNRETTIGGLKIRSCYS